MNPSGINLKKLHKNDKINRWEKIKWLWKGERLHFSPKQETDKDKMDGLKYKKKNICILKLVLRGRGRKLNKWPGN